MFKEEVTQYCPMCQEWAEKYEILEKVAKTYDWAYEQRKKKYDQLKAEVELLRQYKGSKQASYETMQREWNEAKNEVKKLKAENERLKTGLPIQVIGKDYFELIQKADKLEQALQEIKEIAENVIKNVSGRCIETTPMYGVHKQILQICDEVNVG